MCLISNTASAFAPIHNAAITYLDKGYKVIYAAEENDTDVILDRLRRADDRVGEYERKKMLVISQPSKLAARTQRASSRDGVENETYFFLKKYRASGAQGVVVFSSPQNLLSSAGSAQMLLYEKSITEKLSHEPISVICCYHRSTFDRLSFGEMISLIRQHRWILYSGLRFEVSADLLILNVVEHQLNNALGSGSAHLIFKTLRLVYGIEDTDSLI
ncbi:MAG TPA: MEDS domain-containing protein, partial [Nitrososphaera sp.]|nr:MEDS domain-containing protein [Nitrososphaera sp.]